MLFPAFDAWQPKGTGNVTVLLAVPTCMAVLAGGEAASRTRHLLTPVERTTMLISYAQNFEDVILARAFGSVVCGFYIDVGAHDPLVDSVSLAFYQSGWRGVHVDASAASIAALAAHRPDERVIAAAVTTISPDVTFYDVTGTGLSTTCRELAARYESEGRTVVIRTVPTIRLSQILDECGDRPVHWLKIDVEGGEADVIASWQPSAVRPWVVVVESTAPNSTEQTFERWDPTLRALGYDFVYFDGLNRYYLSVSHPELRAAFGYGPSVFDNFTLSGTANNPFSAKLMDEVSRAHAKAAGLEVDNLALKEQLNRAHAAQETLRVMAASGQERLVSRQRAMNRLRYDYDAKLKQLGDAMVAADRLREDIAAIHSSRSWRVTRPIRAARFLSPAELRHLGLARAARVVGRTLLEHAHGYVRKRPRIKAALLRGLALAPALDRRLGAFAGKRSQPPVLMADPDPAALAEWLTLLGEGHGNAKIGGGA